MSNRKDGEWGLMEQVNDDGSVEMVKYWYEYTEEDLERMRMAPIYEARNRFVEDGPETQSDMLDALSEVADLAASNNVTNEELADAVTELAGLIAEMMEG